MTDGFRFKQFYVRQDRCAMKVGTDGVLLGCLCAGPAATILDLGCGTGLIALMLAQRFPEARIVGIDIDPEAAAQAADNFAASPWADRLEAVCADVRSYDGQFNLIVSNPPFYEHSPAASTAARNRARRTDTLCHEELAGAVSRLLTDGGRFSVILPYAEADHLIHTGWLHGLHLHDRTDLRTKPSKPLRRSVLSFIRQSTRQPMPTTRSLTLLNDDSTPSEAYRRLTEDFYL